MGVIPDRDRESTRRFQAVIPDLDPESSLHGFPLSHLRMRLIFDMTSHLRCVVTGERRTGWNIKRVPVGRPYDPSMVSSEDGGETLTLDITQGN